MPKPTSEHRGSTEDQDETFQLYMREVARHPLLTAAQEVALAHRLSDLRAAAWRELVSYAPLVQPIVALVGEVLAPETGLRDSLDALVSAAKAVRRSNRRGPADGYELAKASAAASLAAVDLDCSAADRILADLELLAAGQRDGMSMVVAQVPRAGSRPFAEYVGRVRRAAAAIRCCRNEFARANLRLVVKIALRFHRTGLSLHDRVQEGNIGLMKAVDRFDANRGFRFSTYATWWIKHGIRRAVMNRGRTIRLPSHLLGLAQTIAKKRTELYARLQREPTPRDVAEALELSVEKVEFVLDALARQPVSLDASVREGDERTVLDVLAAPDNDSPDTCVGTAFEVRRMRGRLLSLPEIEREILHRRFGLDGTDEQTLAEIGDRYSLSRERIRQLQHRALARLRRQLERPSA